MPAIFCQGIDDFFFLKSAGKFLTASPIISSRRITASWDLISFKRSFFPKLFVYLSIHSKLSKICFKNISGFFFIKEVFGLLILLPSATAKLTYRLINQHFYPVFFPSPLENEPKTSDLETRYFLKTG